MMNNDYINNPFSYYIHIQLIGNNMTNFLKLISGNDKPSKAKINFSEIQTIEECWDFDYSSNKDASEQIEEYFNILINKINYEERKELRECLIVRVNNSLDKNIITIFENMNNLKKSYLMPIVLFLTNEKDKQIIPNEKYKNINHNLITSKLYSEDIKYYTNDGIIKKLLLRFCSYYNDLGDTISMRVGDNVIDYNLNNKTFPLNFNICCVGRFGQGKSTGINEILNEYKAKETIKTLAEHKYAALYSQSNYPLRILEVPGYDCSLTIKSSIDIIKFYNNKLSILNERIHCFLYFLEYSSLGFMDMEKSLLFEILKIKDAKIIYVITNSPSDLDEEDINDYIKYFNETIDKLFENNMNKNKKYLLKVTKENIAFVNFRKNKYNNKIFGKDILFQKIRNCLHQTEDYKRINKEFTPQQIEKKAEMLKEKAKNEVYYNKIYGGISGIIPGLDYYLQDRVINKNSEKKICSIYGMDINNINQEENPKINENELDLEINNNNLNKEIYCCKIGNSFDLEENKKNIENLQDYSGVILSKSNSILGDKIKTITNSIDARKISYSILGIGSIIGIGYGVYSTNKFSNELIEKCHNSYIKNAKKIYDSFIQLDKYLELFAGLENI